MWSDKARRSWFASFVFLALVIGLIFFLTFLEIPKSNKDLITSIIGMLVGSISAVISIFVGRDPDDVRTMKDTIAELNGDRNSLIERLRDAQIDKDVLRKQLEYLQGRIIERLSIFVGEDNLAKIGGKISPDRERWIPAQKTYEFSDVPGKIGDLPVTEPPPLTGRGGQKLPNPPGAKKEGLFEEWISEGEPKPPKGPGYGGGRG